MLRCSMSFPSGSKLDAVPYEEKAHWSSTNLDENREPNSNNESTEKVSLPCVESLSSLRCFTASRFSPVRCRFPLRTCVVFTGSLSSSQTKCTNGRKTFSPKMTASHRNTAKQHLVHRCERNGAADIQRYPTMLPLSRAIFVRHVSNPPFVKCCLGWTANMAEATEPAVLPPSSSRASHD